MKKYLVIITLLCLQTILFADSSNMKNTDKIIGRWHVIEFNKKNILRNFMIMEYKKNGTCLLSNDVKRLYIFNWKLTGSKLILTEIKTRRQDVYTIKKFEKNSLVIISRFKNYITKYRRVIPFNYSNLIGSWHIKKMDHKIAAKSKKPKNNIISFSANKSYSITKNNKPFLKGLWQRKANYLLFFSKTLRKAFYLEIKNLTKTKLVLYDIEDKFLISSKKKNKTH